MNGLNGIAKCAGKLRHLEAGIGRISTAVVEEITYVMRLEYLDQTFVFTAVLLQAFQLVAAGAERA